MGLYTSENRQARSRTIMDRSKWSVTLVLNLKNVFTSGFNSFAQSR